MQRVVSRISTGHARPRDLVRLRTSLTAIPMLKQLALDETPLLGERLVLVSPTGDWLSSLQWSGVEVVPVPLPVTPAARVVMGALPLSGCLFRSAAEVEALDEERDAPGWNREMTAWCLGADAAAKARQCGWRRVCEFDPALSPADLVEQMMTLGNKTGS